MTKPYDLYTLACRSYDPFDAADGFAEAFDGCFHVRHKGDVVPDVIVHRVRTMWSERWIGRFPHTRVCNPFVWRLAWINPKGLSIGPRRDWDCSIAVIEDYYGDLESDLDDDESLDPPRYLSNNEFSGYVISVTPDHIERSVGIHSQELIEFFTARFEEFIADPVGYSVTKGIIENFWFYDASLPIRIVDGVPESDEHSKCRGRYNYPGDRYLGPSGGWGYVRSRPRRYDLDTDWVAAIEAAEKHLIGDGEVPPDEDDLPDWDPGY